MPRFVRVAQAREILSGASRVVEVEGTPLAIFNVDGAFSAVENRCPHLAGPLGEGRVENGRVHCPWHGWTFDVLSGESPLNPEVKLRRYPVRVEDGEIFVDLEGGDARS